MNARLLRPWLGGVLVTLLACAASAGCSDELPDPWLVVGSRIAAMRAEPTSTRAGVELEIRVLVVRPSASIEPALRPWACALSAGTDPRTCAPPGTLSSRAISRDVIVVDVPADETALEIVAFAALCPDGDLPTGSELDRIVCADGRQASLAYKRVAIVADDSAVAPNPETSALRIDLLDACVETATCARRLELRVDAPSERAEDFVTDFLATAGEIETYRVSGTEPSTRWDPPTGTTQRAIELWAITRDGEGGVAWQHTALDLD